MDLQFEIRQMIKFEVDGMRSDPKMLFKQLTKKAAQFDHSYLARNFLIAATGDLKPIGCDAEKVKRPVEKSANQKSKDHTHAKNALDVEEQLISLAESQSQCDRDGGLMEVEECLAEDRNTVEEQIAQVVTAYIKTV
ncbi:hypothetical protein ABG067_003245 [Albugo candida]